VAANKNAYGNLTKKQKMLLARQLVQLIHDAPGRFLARDGTTGEWYDIGLPRSLEKTSQALREKSSTDKHQGSSGRDTDSVADSSRTLSSPVDSVDMDNDNDDPSSPDSGSPRKVSRQVEMPPVIIPDHLRHIYRQRRAPLTPSSDGGGMPPPSPSTIPPPHMRSTMPYPRTLPYRPSPYAPESPHYRPSDAYRYAGENATYPSREGTPKRYPPESPSRHVYPSEAKHSRYPPSTPSRHSSVPPSLVNEARQPSPYRHAVPRSPTVPSRVSGEAMSPSSPTSPQETSSVFMQPASPSESTAVTGNHVRSWTLQPSISWEVTPSPRAGSGYRSGGNHTTTSSQVSTVSTAVSSSSGGWLSNSSHFGGISGYASASSAVGGSGGSGVGTSRSWSPLERPDGGKRARRSHDMMIDDDEAEVKDKSALGAQRVSTSSVSSTPSRSKVQASQKRSSQESIFVDRGKTSLSVAIQSQLSLEDRVIRPTQSREHRELMSPSALHQSMGGRRQRSLNVKAVVTPTSTSAAAAAAGGSGGGGVSSSTATANPPLSTADLDGLAALSTAAFLRLDETD
jgi:hypothetical protein